MLDKPFSLEIITPQRIVFKGEVYSVSVPGTVGNFQVLFNHAPIISLLEIGKVEVVDKNGKETSFAISGGFFEIKNNKAIVLADSAERSDEIDIERAKLARDRALKRIAERKPDIDIERAKLSFSRAINRIKVAGGK